MLTILAPAKINLTLEVLAKRQDGFHEIRSVIQTINLCDSLRFQSSQSIEIKCDIPIWIPEESLVSKTIKLLQETTGCSEGVTIKVDKRIPLMSGLGGDSSDAAATLRGLNEFWELGLSMGELLELASRLGSDVAFFLYRDTALIEGRGERVTPLPPLPNMWVVLVVPAVPGMLGKTKHLYASLKTSHYTDGQVTERLGESLWVGGEFTPSALFNTFENVAFARFAGLNVYREHIVEIGAADVHLVGSGPTLFTLVKDKAQAEDLHIRCQQQGLESYLTDISAPMDSAE